MYICGDKNKVKQLEEKSKVNWPYEKTFSTLILNS
jgi:hypothetical protein